MQYFLIIGPVFLVILLMWLIIGKKHLKHLQKTTNDEWEMVSERLKKRQSLVPNLVETVKMHHQGQDEMLEKLIAIRIRAAKEYLPGSKKIECEYDLSKSINRVVDLGRSVKELSQDTNFLELRTEINDLEKEIEERSNTYNKLVRKYNRVRKKWWLNVISSMFGFKVYNIFEVEV